MGQSHSRLWGMGSSPSDFRVFHHLRDGLVAEETAVVSASEMAGGWMMGEKEEWVPAPEVGRVEMGEITAFGCVTPDH